MQRDTHFDNFTRAVASAISRRDLFRVSVTGFFGLALNQVGIKEVRAQSTCLCDEESYDPNVTCCTSVGLVSIHPIALDQLLPATISDLETACPNMSQHLGATTCGQDDNANADYNGCGTDAVPLPSHFGKADFTSCCNDHDCCYDGCGAVGGACTSCTPDQGTCDTALSNCFVAACEAAYPSVGITTAGRYLECRAAAAAGYAIVSLVGKYALASGIEARCDCCSVEACQNACAGGACGALPACTGGGDCVCFTSTEGDGACIHGDTPCDEVSSCETSADCPSGTSCVTTSCCGTSGVCGPLCNPVVPASSPSAAKKNAVRHVPVSKTKPIKRLGGFF